MLRKTRIRIRAHCWAITKGNREEPKITFLILLAGNATVAATAKFVAALQHEFDDIAEVAVAVTICSQAFRSMVAQRL